MEEFQQENQTFNYWLPVFCANIYYTHTVQRIQHSLKQHDLFYIKVWLHIYAVNAVISSRELCCWYQISSKLIHKIANISSFTIYLSISNMISVVRDISYCQSVQWYCSIYALHSLIQLIWYSKYNSTKSDTLFFLIEWVYLNLSLIHIWRCRRRG